MRLYSIRQLAQLAGVSVRTLHHYDHIGLLKPSLRTEARYRLYGENELIRLQQILFFKELDFSLEEILKALDNANFDVVRALEQHRQALTDRRNRLATLLVTIDKTIAKLKGEPIMVTDDELYEGFPKEKAEGYRQEAVGKYGVDVVKESEDKLRKLGKEGFKALKAESEDIARTLHGLMALDPASEVVQQQIARHYATIRQYWGESVCQSRNMADAYRGLAQLYVDDLRYTSHNGQENPEYAAFLNKAMVFFADTSL